MIELLSSYSPLMTGVLELQLDLLSKAGEVVVVGAVVVEVVVPVVVVDDAPSPLLDEQLAAHTTTRMRIAPQPNLEERRVMLSPDGSRW
jgi:hypothetical protein